MIECFHGMRNQGNKILPISVDRGSGLRFPHANADLAASPVFSPLNYNRNSEGGLALGIIRPRVSPLERQGEGFPRALSLDLYLTRRVKAGHLKGPGNLFSGSVQPIKGGHYG